MSSIQEFFTDTFPSWLQNGGQADFDASQRWLREYMATDECFPPPEHRDDWAWRAIEMNEVLHLALPLYIPQSWSILDSNGYEVTLGVHGKKKLQVGSFLRDHLVEIYRNFETSPVEGFAHYKMGHADHDAFVVVIGQISEPGTQSWVYGFFRYLNGFCVLQGDAFNREDLETLINVCMSSDPWNIPRNRDTGCEIR